MTARHLALRSAIRSMSVALRRQRVHPSHLRRRSRPERADIAAALRWNHDHNVLGFGIGRKISGGTPGGPDRALIVFVATKLPKNRLRRDARIPQRMHLETVGGTVQTDVVEIGSIPMLQTGPVLRPGADAAHFSMRDGTLTAIVRAKAPPFQPLLLSCSHGFAPLGAAGREIESPPDLSPLTATNLVAGLAAFEPLKPGGGVANRMDAAIAVPIAGRISGVTNVVPGLGAITSASPLASGEFASHGIRQFVGVGAMSTRIAGTLIAENASSVFMDPRGRVFLFQDLLAYQPNPLPQAGDSGMPIVRPTAAGLELLGMHIGVGRIGNTNVGAAFFVPIGIVLDRFSVEIA